jgi:hypothetical protein
MHWADAVDEEEEDTTVDALAAILREKLRPGELLKSRALTTGMAVHTCSADAATCERALDAVKNDVPPELNMYFEDGSFYVQLSSSFYMS